MIYDMELCTKIFNSIVNPQWRIWKIVDGDGIVRQNKFLISTPGRLLKFVNTFPNNKAVYVSSSTFLNPHKNHGFFSNQKKQHNGHYFYPREGYLTADNILIESYFFIDLDSEQDLRIAQEDARKILANINLKLHSIQFSGTKGIHLIYNHEPINEPDPHKRILKYKEEKARLVNQLKKLNLQTMDEHHEKIFQDVWRVYAAPYSYKSNGNQVMPIPMEKFIFEDIYTLIAHNVKREAREPVKGNDNKVASFEGYPSSVTVSERGQRAGPSSPLHFYFLDNMVRGLKNNYVLVIKKNKTKYSTQQLKDLIKTYKLSSFYVYQQGEHIYAINLKLMQFKRVIKILRKVKSENLYYFLTRRHAPIPVSPYLNEDGSVNQEYKFIEKIESNFKTTNSKPHSVFYGADIINTAGKANRLGKMRVVL